MSYLVATGSTVERDGGAGPGPVAAAGAGVPGLFDEATGRTLLLPNLPAAWAGLTNGELEAVCGVPGASFCHNGRFIAAARTREAALAMAGLAVEEAVSIGKV